MMLWLNRYIFVIHQQLMIVNLFNLISMKQFTLLAVLIFTSFVAPFTAQSCSAFLLKGKDYSVIGFNENWKTMPGMVVINGRGVQKTGMSWKQLVSETQVPERQAKWTSRYGSVSFNLLGVDMPCYGINEKGLFIVELYLAKTYSIADEKKANLFWGHWIQYQLDNFATVGEVVAHLNEAPVIDWWPTFPGSHFFLSDKKGNTAAVELIDGKYVISTGKTMPVPVLCNKPYQQELNTLSAYKAFGGEQEFDMTKAKLEWSERYTKAAHYMNLYNAKADGDPIDYAWNALNNIGRGEWQLIYDVLHTNIQFRTDTGKEVKTIDMKAIDFSAKTPLFLDINAMLNGEVLSHFAPLTPSVNKEYVAKGFPIGYENAEFANGEAFVTLQQNIDRYVRSTYFNTPQ